METQANYIKAVLRHIVADKKTKKRIKEDLEIRLSDGFNEDPYFNPENDMGTPQQVAEEFMDNLDIDYSNPFISVRKPYEYKSKRTLFGLPLVHIKTSNNTAIPATAKGIIAIGDMAMGVVALGGVATGGIAFGGVSLGLVTVGGVAIGAFAFGGVAIGLVAFGGVAIGLLKALGGLGILFPK